MKFFTRELIERYGSDDDAVAGRAHNEWETILARYESSLQSVAGDLPDHIRAFTNLLLHDAVVWSIARLSDRLILVVHKDIPPRNVVILTYALIAEPIIDKTALSHEDKSSVMDWLYDEFEVVREVDRTSYAQSILFGNGWEISLRFSDVQVTLADPVYPLPVRTASDAQSA